MSARGIDACVAVALAMLLGACAAPPPTPQGTASADARHPASPKPGEVAYNQQACGGDHGMIEELNDDDRGRLRVGPPQMSICP